MAESRSAARVVRPGSGRSRRKRELLALAALLLGACSFSSEPLLAGQRGDIGDDDSSSGVRDPDDARGRDGGNDTTVLPNAGSGGGGAGSGGASAADDAAAGGTGGAASTDAGADAQVDDASTTPDPTPDAATDPQPDAATDPDTGMPPDPDCKCVCPHELKAALGQPRSSSCPLVGCAVDACAPNSDCKLSSLGTRGYYVCEEPHTWEEAKAHCEELPGVSLASVDDADEDDFLLNERDDKTWVGGNDLKEEGEFVWDNGDAFWSGGAEIWEGGGPGPGGGPGGGPPGPGWEGGEAVNGAYTNWLSYEPNDEGLEDEGGDCVMLWPEQDAWADASCDDPHGYVCEFALPPGPVNPGPLNP